MNRRIRVMITREGWSYIGMLAFIIAGAVIRDINLLYIMAGMMLGPLLVSFYLAPKSLRKLTLTRRFPRLVGVGDPLFVDVVAEKPKHAPAGFAIAIRDRLRRAGGRGKMRGDARLFLPHVPSGRAAEASYRASLWRRGRFAFGPMRVTCSAPLGLIRATRIVSLDDVVLVSPRLGQLLPAWKRRLDLQKEGSQRSLRRRGKDGDFYGMREYRNGDSRNWIHWRTTAKRNKLTVRQFEQKINQNLVLVLDLWQAEAPRGTQQAVEDGISFAATLIVEHGKFGASHLLIASASEAGFLLKGTSSPVFRQEVMEHLAMVEATREDRLPALLAEVLTKRHHRSRVILVTTRKLDFADTDHFAEIWKQPNLRRNIGDIIQVDTTSAEFAQWFRASEADALPSPQTAVTETPPPAQEVAP